MTKFIIAVVTAGLLVIVGVVSVPKILTNMGKDISDTDRYADRMSALIADSPNCAKYKNRFTELGKNAASMNGSFTYAMVQVKQAANEAGCSKP
jgi:hypothetical protein